MAGVVRVPLWRFVLFDAIGAALWSGVAIALGFVFRDAIDDVLDVLAGAGQDRARADRRWRSSPTSSAKWWQRQRFIRQLRMDRVTVDELRELHRRGPVGDGDRRALADVAGGHRAHSRRGHRRSRRTCSVELLADRARRAKSSSIARARTRRRPSRSRRRWCSTASSACGRCTAASTRGSRRATTSSTDERGCGDVVHSPAVAREDDHDQDADPHRHRDAPAAIGPYSQAIRAGNTVYLSGQIGLDPATGNSSTASRRRRTRCSRNLRAVAAGRGRQPRRHRQAVDPDASTSRDFAKVNEIMAAYFTPPYPARATYQVAALAARRADRDRRRRSCWR